MRFLLVLSTLRFKFRLLPFVAALIVTGIGSALGQWQINRAHQKQELSRQFHERGIAPLRDVRSLSNTGLLNAADAPEFQRWLMRGQFLSAWPIYLDNRPYQGRAGFYLLMPFRLSPSGEIVMIARGWVARNTHDRTALPALNTPTGTVDLEGRLRSTTGKVMQLGQAPSLQPGAIIQNLDLREFAKASGLPVASYLIEQTSTIPDGLIRDWPQPSLGIDRHYGYAFQWYALAVLAVVFFLATSFIPPASTAAKPGSKIRDV